MKTKALLNTSELLISMGGQFTEIGNYAKTQLLATDTNAGKEVDNLNITIAGLENQIKDLTAENEALKANQNIQKSNKETK